MSWNLTPIKPWRNRGRRLLAAGLAVFLAVVLTATMGACAEQPPPPAEGDAANGQTEVAPGDEAADTESGDVEAEDGAGADVAPAPHTEADLLAGVRQLIFEGQRSGEGYFDPEGRRMIFQAEREDDNPFYQIYLMDLETGDTERVSPGPGKTTCAWIHPDGEKVLYASTHDDPEAEAKMQAEFEAREAEPGRRYSFEYDDTYEIYEAVLGGSDLVNLTNAPGYDAEGSWSPDGSKIAFTSNRLAYSDPLSDEDLELFERDASYMADIYIMDADGGNVTRLTEHKGYDGGPFFSPDGQRITWRRFNAEGTLAEVWTMNVDGSDQQQLTEIEAMSWAPYYHPSGDYLVFTTNLHGFDNFEVYMVDVAGEKEPVRVTFTDGPDVLPVFTPAGDQLAWVSRRGDGDAQIHIGDWDDAKARELLALSPARGAVTYGADAGALAAPDMASTAAEISAEDARAHVERLASEEMGGRETGTPGEAMATEYVAAVFGDIGLEPAGTEGYFQPFPFTAGVSMAGVNALAFQTPDGEEIDLEVETDWRPLAFSNPGPVGFTDLAFAGYGIVAPEDGEQPAYDAYGDLDVAGKWVVVLRYMPEDISPERRQHLDRHASLRFKALEAADRGATGLVVVSGPNSQVKDPLVPLVFDGAVAGASVPAVSVSDETAARLFEAAGEDLAAAQTTLDGGEEVVAFDVPDLQMGAFINLEFEEETGRNVLGRLQVGDAPSEQVVIVGAHVDHIGLGEGGDSLADASEQGQVHYGADDNASGVAGLLEIAQHMADLQASGELEGLDRDVLFAAWSGEELGLLGSSHFVKTFDSEGEETIYPDVSAYMNMDMIGRFEDEVVLQGVGSSSVWTEEIERRNVPVGLPITLSDDTYLPTDATSFYLKGVPILSAFTGVHSEYNTPRDTPDTLDYESLAKVARLMALITRSVADADAPPDYVEVEAPQEGSSSSGGRRVYMGTIPDMTDTSGGGVLLSGVGKGGPAEEAGLQAGDTIVEMAGVPINDLYEYSRAIDALKIGEEIEVVVLRDGERLTLVVTPASRE